MLFDDVESIDLPKFKSIVARIVVKFRRRHDNQHFILQDITVSHWVKHQTKINDINVFLLLIRHAF
jgi:hypothetical protein